MTRTPFKSVTVLLVTMLALSIALVGTATVGNAAAGVTKAQVKKIAKRIANKVVTNRAPTLSVAHAASATNATLLNGQTAGTYLNSSYRFRLPTQAAATDKTYSFPGLPVGTYLFTYNVVVNGGAAGNFCYMRPAAPNTNGEGFEYLDAPGTGFGTASSSGIIQTTAAVNLRCAGASFTIYNGGDVSTSVTFTKIDSLTAGTSTAPRGDSGGAVGKPGSPTG